MPPGGRGRGGKFSKPTRGGGKSFSKNLTPLDADGNPMSMWSDIRNAKPQESSSEEESSEEESEESSADETPQTSTSASTEQTREQRRAAAKARKEAAIKKKTTKVAAVGDMPSDSDAEDADDDMPMPANPNHSSKSRSQAAAVPVVAKDGSVVPPVSTKAKKTDPSNLSRREREALAAAAAKERYQKLHAEGKTEEAQSDLARLKLVRERREMEAARKKAEQEEREEAEKRRLDEMDEKERKKREAALGIGSSAPAKGKKK